MRGAMFSLAIMMMLAIGVAAGAGAQTDAVEPYSSVAVTTSTLPDPVSGTTPVSTSIAVLPETLPVTGIEVASLAVIGGAVLAVGALTVWLTRRRSET